MLGRAFRVQGFPPPDARLVGLGSSILDWTAFLSAIRPPCQPGHVHLGLGRGRLSVSLLSLVAYALALWCFVVHPTYHPPLAKLRAVPALTRSLPAVLLSLLGRLSGTWRRVLRKVGGAGATACSRLTATGMGCSSPPPPDSATLGGDHPSGSSSRFSAGGPLRVRRFPFPLQRLSPYFSLLADNWGLISQVHTHSDSRSDPLSSLNHQLRFWSHQHPC